MIVNINDNIYQDVLIYLKTNLKKYKTINYTNKDTYKYYKFLNDEDKAKQLLIQINFYDDRILKYKNAINELEVGGKING